MTILEYIAAGPFFAALLAVTLAMSTYPEWFTADAKRDAEADKQDKLKREMQAATCKPLPGSSTTIVRRSTPGHTKCHRISVTGVINDVLRTYSFCRALGRVDLCGLRRRTQR